MENEHIIPLKIVLIDEVHDSTLIIKGSAFSIFLLLLGRIANKKVDSFHAVPSQLLLQVFYSHIAIDNRSDGQRKDEHFVGPLLRWVELKVTVHNLHESDVILAEGDHKRPHVFDLGLLFQVMRVGINEEIAHLGGELSHVEAVVLFRHG
jgi:hypothetical protein